MKKWLRRSSSLLAAGVVAGTLAACSGNTGNAGTSAAADQTAAGSQGTADEKITLEFYGWLDEEGIFNKLAEEYKKTHPNIEISFHLSAQQNYDQTLLTAVSGGAEMDVMAFASPPGFASYQSKGQVIPIDDYVAEFGTDTSGYQTTFDALKMDGKAYVLPYKTSSWVVYYNKDIFDAAGVEYPTGDWTWDDYYDVAGKLTSGEGGDKIYGSLNFQPTSMWWRSAANTKGSTNPRVESELADWMDSAAFWKSLSDAGYQPPYADRANEAGADYAGSFLQGKYGMFVTGDWAIEMLNTAIAGGETLNYDIAPIPHYEGVEPMTTGTQGIFAISKEAKHPKEAYELIAWMTGEEGAQLLVENDYFPAWSSDEIIEKYTSGKTNPEHIEFIVNQPIYPQVPCDPFYNTAANIVKEEVSLYLVGEQDLDTTHQNIKDRMKNEIVE